MPIDPDYVDVAERLRQFYDKYPDGRITRLDDPRPLEVGGKVFIMYSAAAYRTADDPRPCIGTAWEPFPGPTNFTRDSELMNAETSAWGRAIVAAGIPSKKIASADELRNRSGNGGSGQVPQAPSRREPSPAQIGKLKASLSKAGVKKTSELEALILDCGLTDVLPIDKDWMARLTGGRDGTVSVLIERVMRGALPDPDHPSDVPSDGFEGPSPEDVAEASRMFKDAA